MDVATDPRTETGFAPPPEAEGGRVVGHAVGMVEALTQLADLQVRLWLAELRNAAARILLAVMFSGLAVLLAIATAAFVYAGVFHILTDILHIPTVWALLIFAAVHGLAAGALVVLALNILKRGAAASASGSKP